MKGEMRNETLPNQMACDSGCKYHNRIHHREAYDKARIAEWNRADDQQIRKDIADLRTNLEKMKLYPDAPSFRNNALESSMRLQSCGIAPVAEIAKQVNALVGNNNIQSAINAASALTSYPAAASLHRTFGFLSRLRFLRR